MSETSTEEFRDKVMDIHSDMTKVINAGYMSREDPWYQSLTTTASEIASALKKYGYEIIDGKKGGYDENMHQIVGVVPTPDEWRDEAIAHVIEFGYKSTEYQGNIYGAPRKAKVIIHKWDGTPSRYENDRED